ncbi:MAG: hypothetical protein U0835_01555 [Isosphaeraceae bacterium]
MAAEFASASGWNTDRAFSYGDSLGPRPAAARTVPALKRISARSAPSPVRPFVRRRLLGLDRRSYRRERCPVPGTVGNPARHL